MPNRKKLAKAAAKVFGGLEHRPKKPEAKRPHRSKVKSAARKKLGERFQ